MTIFVLNLAFADLLYCTVNLPLYTIQYLLRRWPLSFNMCVAFASSRYFIAAADWMSLALIAFSRCIALTRPSLAKKLFSSTNGKLFIVGTWAYAAIVIVPFVFEVRRYDEARLYVR